MAEKIKCVPLPEAKKLRTGISNGDINIEKMMSMDSAKRRALFEKYTHKDMAKFINTEFEKAMVSSRVDALEKWAKSAFTGKNKPRLKDITDRINELKEKDLLSPEKQDLFMEDLVAEKLGVTITKEEGEKIVKLSDDLTTAASKESELGTPSIEYLKKRKELDSYVESLNPSSKLKVATSIIGRGTLLLSVKSPITNIAGNTAISITESFARRLQKKQFKGLKDKMFTDYLKFNLKAYKESGYDLSRLYTLKNPRKYLGEEIITSQGPGLTRKIGRFYENTVFKYLMGAPDVAFATAHFVDAVSLDVMKVARQEGLKGMLAKKRAKEIAKDALRLEPETNIGIKVRESAIKDAERATFTDPNNFAKASAGIRKFLNFISGNLRLGDNLIPFAKVPATVVARAVEASGVTSLWDIHKLVKGLASSDGDMVRNASRKLITAGLGLTGAYIITNFVKPDDFVGEYADYNPSERKLIEAEGATYDAIRFGDKWVSADYLTPLSAPLIGMLNARKYGKNPVDKIVKYYTGVGRQLLRVPGYNQLMETLKDFKDLLGKDADIKETAQDAATGMADFVSARIIPAIISDIAKATDEFERTVDYSGDKKKLVKQKIYRKLPLLRETLPEKIDMFGKKIKTQPPWASLAFGSRYKEGVENDRINELNRLSAQSSLPTLTDIARSRGQIKIVKEHVGAAKFNNIVRAFGKRFDVETKRMLKDPKYINASDEDKKDMWNKTRKGIIKLILKPYKTLIKADKATKEKMK